MNRRQFLKLGAVTGGVFALGGSIRAGGRSAFAQSAALPIVERLVMTNVVDNIYDVFAKGGKLDTITVERMRGSIGVASPAAEQATSVAGHAFTTGQIPRLTAFERPPAAARLVAGAMDSACSPAHFGATKVETKPGELVADTFEGEHATAYHVKDRGLVVITSCRHAGASDSGRQVQQAAGIDKVHAVGGGFHLAPAADEIVAKTVEAFKAINPDYIIPSHCTGLNTIIAVHRAMPQKLVMPSTGTRVIFGA